MAEALLGKGRVHVEALHVMAWLLIAALANAGDRLVTPWLKLLGKGAPDPPMVHIFLKRSGNILKKAKAEVCLAAGA